MRKKETGCMDNTWASKVGLIPHTFRLPYKTGGEEGRLKFQGVFEGNVRLISFTRGRNGNACT